MAIIEGIYDKTTPHSSKSERFTYRSTMSDGLHSALRGQ